MTITIKLGEEVNIEGRRPIDTYFQTPNTNTKSPRLAIQRKLCRTSISNEMNEGSVFIFDDRHGYALFRMGPVELESTTYRLKADYSIQLNYGPYTLGGRLMSAGDGDYTTLRK